MNEMNKIRIICNPYEKKIEYLWYFREEDEFRSLDEYSPVLSNEKYLNATIQNRAFEIIQIINQYFNPGNMGVDIYFTGNAEDYADLCSVIETYYLNNNIKCIKDNEYYYSADTVMPQIKEKFSKVESTLDSYKEERITELLQKYNDTIKPSISVCIMGLYSAGKSAFINGLIGNEILPSASDPTTAKICKIVSADACGISVLVNNQVHNILFKGNGFAVEGNYAVELKESLDKSLEKYKAFAIQQFKKNDRDLVPEVVDEVYNRFQGVTQCLQRVMNVLFLFTDKGKTCQMGMVDEAITYLLNMLSDNYETQLSQIPEKQRNVFRAIAQEGIAQNTLSAAFIRKYHLPSSSSVSSALKALLDKDLITQENGAYSIYDQFFALWLKFKGMI